MKSIVTLLLIVLTGSSFAQSRTFLDYINESTPIYPGCETAENRQDCYREKVGALIEEKINKHNPDSLVNGKEIQIKVTIYNKNTGESTYKAENGNDTITELALSALKNLPLLTPIKDLKGVPQSSTYSFYITLRHDMSTQLYKQVIINDNEKLRQQPHPFPMSKKS